MKYFLLVCLFALIGILPALAQDTPPSTHVFIPADNGSTIGFGIKNMGFNTKGSLSGLQGRIVFDPKNPAGASFDVSVDANTISTDNDMRDSHLKKEDYFDVANYPRIRFVSAGITPSGKNGSYTITGKLTIKNTTKDISFPFIAAPIGADYVFSGSFKINRRDFGIGGSSTISNELTVSLSVLATHSSH
jgi:polyisoprenoid-binding protein YceI